MNPLVEPAWLASRLGDPDIVVLDATLPPVGASPPVDTKARYLTRHIPGAVFFDIEELSDRSTSLPHMLPTADAFATAMSALGVGSKATIVVYEQKGVFSAPRAGWMLRTFGARSVSLLNGGLRAWIDSGLPTESGHVQRPADVFDAQLNSRVVNDFAGIQKLIAERGQILDARSAGRFSGTSPEPRPGINAGHMPGAISLPYTELCEDGRLRSADALRRIIESKHVDLGKPITTTCGSGVTAAVLALGLEIAGAANVRLYDGSWAEYAQRADAVIEKYM